MSPLLDARDLTRRYGDHHAVDGVSLRLDRGEIVGFLGPNGAGKSTCLRVLTGNLRPDSGEVQVDGIDLLRRPLPAKARIGYLPDRPPLHNDQRVDEYLEFCARLHRVPRAGIGAAVALAKRRCGLDDAGRKLIGRLSKGYRQRVGIAQAIVHRPPLLILDEPTLGLDPHQTRELRAMLKEFADTAGILLSSHQLGEVQAVCERVLILDRGRVVHAGAIAADAQKRLRVTLEHPPDAASLLALPGVRGADAEGKGSFLLQLAPEARVAEVSRSLAESGWGLLALGPAPADLERIFTDLVTGREAA